MRIAKPQGPSPKSKPYRSKAYRRHVASFPCVCGHHETQCSHVSAGNNALSMKAPDYYTTSLCIPHGQTIGCHKLFDRNQRVFSLHLFKMTVEAKKNDCFNNWFEWEINRIFSQPKFLKLD